jgi:CubicO group peptidase (beta-lactamase class C family)
MKCSRILVRLSVVGALGLHSVAAQPFPFPTQTNCAYDLTAVTQAFTNTLKEAGIANGSLLVLRNGENLYERYAGIFNANTVRPIASASKWLSAVVIMSLVDDGLMELDDPVSNYFPQFYTGNKGMMTIRQMLSHTSGLPGDEESSVLSDDTITLQQAAQIISTNDLIAMPGAVFCYGGLSMQVAGACAEMASGMSWSSLVQTRLKQPLGLTVTTYGNTQNPRIAGGVSSTMHEYAIVLQMLLNQGVWGTNRLLSLNAVREMQRDQTGGAMILCSPATQYGEGDKRYGLGEWRDLFATDGSAIQVSCPGAFGCAPWVDVERNIAGVFFVFDRYSNVLFGVEEIQAAVRNAIDSTPCTFPPRLEIQPAVAGTNLVTVNGARGHSFRLEISSNLSSWTESLDLPGTNGVWQVLLSATNGPRQFFRARILQ